MKVLFLAVMVAFSLGTSAQMRIDSSFFTQTIPPKDYSIYIPSSYNSNTPNKMMLGLHPFNTNRWDAIAWCDTLIAFAEANNLLLVCPDGGADGRVDDAIDTAFTSALLDSMEVWYNVDTDNVYAMGFSVGGRATYTYGLLHKPRIRGLIPIGAAISGAGQFTTTMRSNMNCMPVYIVHGSQDAPSLRYTPAVNSLTSNSAVHSGNLMSGVGHTIDFPNRNSILTTAYQWIDSVNNGVYTVSMDTLICSGDTVAIQATGGNNYTWQGTDISSTTIANPSVWPSANTTYSVTISDVDGCVYSTQSVSVQVTDTCKTQGTYLNRVLLDDLSIKLVKNNILIGGLKSGNVSYEIIDLSGRSIQKGELRSNEQAEIKFDKRLVQPIILKLTQPNGLAATRLLQP